MGSNALTFRGKVYTSSVETYTDEQIAAGEKVLANVINWLGVVSKFLLTPSVERVKLPEYHTGDDTTYDSWSRVTGGTVELTCDESKPENFALNLMGVSSVVGPQSVTGAFIGKKIGSKWTELDGTTSLVAGVAYKFVREISADGYVMVPYGLIDSTTFTLYDSSATPKELVLNTDFTMNAIEGWIKLKDTAGHGVNLSGLTYPLQADFDVGQFIDTMPKGLVNNGEYGLSYANISNYTVKDSSGTPKTIDDTYYEIDSQLGVIKITNLTAIKAVSGITFPLRVFATRGDVRTIGILAGNQIEKQLRVNGENVRTGQKVVITLWRVSFEASPVDFFDKDWVKTPLKGEIMSDPSRPDDNILGRYGKIEYI